LAAGTRARRRSPVPSSEAKHERSARNTTTKKTHSRSSTVNRKTKEALPRNKPTNHKPTIMQALFDKLLPPILHPSSGGGATTGGDGSSNSNRNGQQRHNNNSNHGGTTAHSNHANNIDADHGNSMNMMMITEILDTDILCGKDKTYNLHAGNVRYRHLIESHGVMYHAAITKHEKTKITRSVLDILDREHCRFLQPVEGGELAPASTASTTDSRPQQPTAWTIVPRQKARDKTSHALRFYCQQHRPGEQPPIVQQQPSTNKMNGHHVQPQHASSNASTTTKGKSDNAGGGGGVDVVDGAYIFQRQQQLLREQLDRAQQQQQQQKMRPQPPQQTQQAQPQQQQQSPTTQQQQQQHRLAMMMLMNGSPPSSTRSAAGNETPTTNTKDETFDTLRSQDVRDIIDEHYGGLSNDHEEEEHEDHNHNDSIMNMMVVGNTSDTLRSQDLRMILDDDNDHDAIPPHVVQQHQQQEQQRADDDDMMMMMEEG
jgi:hypothetical protein